MPPSWTFKAPNCKLKEILFLREQPDFYIFIIVTVNWIKTVLLFYCSFLSCVLTLNVIKI